MKAFLKKHPTLADVCDTILSLLSGRFALVAVGFIWLRERLGKRREGGRP